MQTFLRVQFFMLLLFAASLTQPLAAQDKNRARNAAEREAALEAAGSVEGAIWAFELKLGPTTLRGRYRVLDLQIYQSEMPRGEMNKKIGVSKPDLAKKLTTVEFESLQVTAAPGVAVEPMKGTAFLRPAPGGVEGEFVDGKGVKWKMRARRIQE